KEENNKFHQSPLANEIRYFIQLLYLSLAGYTGMGFECRDNIPKAPGGYSGCYTNYQNNKYSWGNNFALFEAISKIRDIYSKIITKDTTSVLLNSSINAGLVWINCEKDIPKYLFVVNFDTSSDSQDIQYECPYNLAGKKLKPYFSLFENKMFLKEIKENLSVIKNVKFAQARIYEIL
ncbi:hypothetical protein IJ531_03305, partial [bacterium]|nr:hypothetical protein [bacterium]